MISVLSSKDREEIFNTMTDFQIDVIMNHVMYRVKSELLTASFWKGIHWELLGVNYDRLYRKKLNQRKYKPSLYCECGRSLKYQYVVKSKETGEILELGKECFTQRTGIPERIAEEIYNSRNKINIFQDEILSAYKFRKRFPIELYNEIHLNKVDDKWSPYYNKKILDFKKANLPLFHRDQDKLENDLIEYKVRKRQLKRLLGVNFEVEYTENYVYLIKYMENRILNDRKLNQGERKKLIQDLYKISKAVNESISTDFAKLTANKRNLITVEYIDPLNVKIKNFNLSYKEALSESRNIARKIMDYANGKKIEKNTKIKQVTNKQVNTNNTSNVRLDHGLNGIKKDTSKKSEVDILLEKEEEKIVELNALQIQIYGKDAVQFHRNMKKIRSTKEIGKSINEINKKYEEYTKIKKKYMDLIEIYSKSYPALINRLNEISDEGFILSNNIEDGYIKMLDKYNGLPKISEEENKLVKYFMLKHKVNIPGKGIKQGYSLSASLKKFKQVKDVEVKKILLEYLVLKVELTKEIIRFRQQNMRDIYFRANEIISKYDAYSYNKNNNIELHDIIFLISSSAGNIDSTDIRLSEDVEFLKHKLESIIAKSEQKGLINGILNELVKMYERSGTITRDILNILNKIVERESTFYYGAIYNSVDTWKQEFIDFLYKVNYYYIGNKLPNDFLNVDKKILNKNLEFLVFIDEVVKPRLETVTVSKQEFKMSRSKLIKRVKKIYGGSVRSEKNSTEKYLYRIRKNISIMNVLSSYGYTKRKLHTEVLLAERLMIQNKKVEMIRKVLEKYSQRNSDDFKREIRSLPISNDLKKRIIFFEKNKKDILELQDVFKSKIRN
ncbi:hypothetical protein [Ligilactobacillus salivarius]|uniref:hypothetical protein n=1 Tax=Ligilactobacillus salivarius TaxID=1624 RepID=UPI001F50E0B4|nr:hypothetical protein [Ligilactobacillus salivarius]